MPNLQDIKPAVEFAELNNSEGWEQVPGGAAHCTMRYYGHPYHHAK